MAIKTESGLRPFPTFPVVCYPLFLNLEGQRVVVIGGGRVATRKVRSLRRAGARVTVISPQRTAMIRHMSDVRWLRRRYRVGDLRGAVLAVAATDDLTVNRRVCAEAKRRRQLINCVAPPEAGNFIVPSVVRHGALAIAISTGGVNPSQAKAVRKKLESVLR